MRWRQVITVGFLLTPGVFSLGCQAAQLPNVVLIYVDDLGWRDLGVMGSQYYETPHIDALAREGMRFTNAYSNAPNCAPARASLLSGQYQPRHGVYTVGTSERGNSKLRQLVPVVNQTELALETITIPEALNASGYVSGQVGKWHLGGSEFLPDNQGFDWTLAGDQFGSPPSYFYPYMRDGRVLPDLSDGEVGEYLTDRLTDEAIDFIRNNREAPFFLYLSHYGVHTPIQAESTLVQHYIEKGGTDGQSNPTYAAMIHSIDDSVGRILKVLADLALADRTIVIFFSDNGGFGPVTSMAPLRGSKGMLYEGGIRVPLVVRWPTVVPANMVSDEPVIGLDLFPTILDITGTPLPEGQVLDGVSLLPVFRGSETLVQRDLFWHFPAYLQADASVMGPWRTTPASAVRRGNYKLITFFEDGRNELYNLADDLSEAHDLSRVMPDRTNELRAELEQWWRDTGAWLPTESNELYDPAVHEEKFPQKP